MHAQIVQDNPLHPVRASPSPVAGFAGDNSLFISPKPGRRLRSEAGLSRLAAERKPLRPHLRLPYTRAGRAVGRRIDAEADMAELVRVRNCENPARRGDV